MEKTEKLKFLKRFDEQSDAHSGRSHGPRRTGLRMNLRFDPPNLGPKIFESFQGLPDRFESLQALWQRRPRKLNRRSIAIGECLSARYTGLQDYQL